MGYAEPAGGCANRSGGCSESLIHPASNHRLERTAHSAGFVGYSWRFLLWAAAEWER